MSCASGLNPGHLIWRRLAGGHTRLGGRGAGVAERAWLWTALEEERALGPQAVLAETAGPGADVGVHALG